MKRPNFRAQRIQIISHKIKPITPHIQRQARGAPPREVARETQHVRVTPDAGGGVVRGGVGGGGDGVELVQDGEICEGKV